ncbi:MAG TPA: DUF4870 domain-containing protein [Candidatus Paceibacterota bacterium]|nr:DUF4870 domain-containing protein [Candidatus Paceibacterota bacterium]
MPNNHNDGAGAEHAAHHEAHHAAVSSKNMMAIFAYLWILIVIPFLTETRKEPFVKFHLKQGLALIIFDVIGWIVAFAIGWIPVLGWLIVWLWWIVSLVLVIIGIVNVLNGQEKELPIVGKYGKRFDF